MTITNGYAELAEQKTWQRIDDTTDDARIEVAVEAASRLVDDYCGRRFWPDAVAAARTYAARRSSFVTVDDISSTSGLVVKTDEDGDGTFETTWSSTDYQLEPLNSLARDSKPAWRLRAVGNYLFPVDANGRACVEVTAKWGWPAVPAPVKQATMIQAARLVGRRDSRFGIAGAADVGELRLLARVDADVAVLLAPFRRGVHVGED